MASRRRPRRRVRYRGTELDDEDIGRIRQLIRRHPRWGRTELARRVCQLYDWRRPNGEYSTRSCLDLLGRLQRQGWIRLSAPRRMRREPGTKAASPRHESLGLGPTPGWESLVVPGAPLVVRPIVAEELAGWRAYMQRFHYLGDCTLVGESLRYAAIVDGELAALLSWSTAALHSAPRDHYVGWDAATKAKNLSGIVNNSRFLIMPWIRQQNLASRILGTNLRRLRADWQARYQHPVLMAETFVDATRFHGGCYRASNWVYVGQTKGWSKGGTSYSFHGHPKAVFVYPLCRGAVQRLCRAPQAHDGDDEAMKIRERKEAVTLDMDQLGLDGEDGLLAVLETVSDARKARGKMHPMQYILACALCATLAGAKSFVAIADWAQDQSREDLKRIGSKYGRAPNERTFRRVLKEVNVAEIDDKTGAWVARQQALQPGQALALDGKTLRGSRDGESQQVHLLSAIVHGSSVVIAQTPVPGKTNEITCVEPLLRNLDIEGCVVSADALHTQKKTAQYIVEEKKADYVFTVKDNQPTLREDIDDLHMESFPPSG